MLNGTNTTSEVCGVVRKLDSLGRIVIPAEYRRQLQIKDNEPLEMLATENEIIIRKTAPEKTVIELLEDLHHAVQSAPNLQGKAEIMQKLEKVGVLISKAGKD